MIRSMVTASLSVGGGFRMVQGVLGTHAHQSNYSTERKSNSENNEAISNALALGIIIFLVTGIQFSAEKKQVFKVGF